MVTASTPALDHAQIASRIPHAGRMCLLDRVMQWDAQRIVCRATNHRRADHPLRLGAHLPIAAGIEYAAQAIAVHGSLLAEGASDARGKKPPPLGFLTSARDVYMHARWLDEAGPRLRIEALRLAGDESGLLYRFALSAAQQALLEGRLSVMLMHEEPAARAQP